MAELLKKAEIYVFSLFFILSLHFDVSIGDSNSLSVNDFQNFDFDVKPGGLLQKHTEQWGGVSCIFTYACQGGTKELWSLSIKKNEDGMEYACSVERPSGVSYLFFEKFELELSGVLTKEALVIGENGKQLMATEYKHKEDESKVVYTDEFRSHLTKVELYGVAKKKQEL